MIRGANKVFDGFGSVALHICFLKKSSNLPNQAVLFYDDRCRIDEEDGTKNKGKENKQKIKDDAKQSFSRDEEICECAVRQKNLWKR